MLSASDTLPPVGEAFLAAVNDVEMLETATGSSDAVQWSSAALLPISVSQGSSEKRPPASTRSSSNMYEPRSNIASVVRASEVGLLSLLQEIDKVLVTPTSVRHRSNVREKLYQDPVVQQGSVVRDRSPARQPSQLAVPSSGMFKNPPVSDLEDVNQSSCTSAVVEVSGVVHAASVIPAASVHQVSSSGFAPAPRVGVHWGSEVC